VLEPPNGEAIDAPGRREGVRRVQGSRNPRHYVVALLASNVCASTAFGILSPTIVANSVERGTTSLSIGILTSIWALPFLVGAPFYTRIVARFSAKPCLVMGMAGAVISLCLFPVFPQDGAWIALQLVCGATLGHFSLIMEAWLNLFSTEATRARVMALYGVLPAIGYAMGAGLYVIVGFRGFTPFLTAAAAMATGLLPLWSIPRDAADIVLGGDERIGHALTEIPLLLAIAFLAGVLETVPWGLMQVYATDNGWSVRAAGFVLPVFYWGQILLTYPVGWIADRIPRRSVLMGTSAAAILCMLALGSSSQSPALWVIIFVSGGIATGTYTLGLAVLGQRFDARSLVSANAAFMACYGLGTISGPPAVGEFMDRLGQGALPTALAIVGAAIFLCALGARAEWRTGAPSPSAFEKSG